MMSMSCMAATAATKDRDSADSPTFRHMARRCSRFTSGVGMTGIATNTGISASRLKHASDRMLGQSNPRTRTGPVNWAVVLMSKMTGG